MNWICFLNNFLSRPITRLRAQFACFLHPNLLINSNTDISALAAHHADLSGHQVTQPVEPPDISLHVGGFLLLVTEARLLKTRRDRQTDRSQWRQSKKHQHRGFFRETDRINGEHERRPARKVSLGRPWADETACESEWHDWARSSVAAGASVSFFFLLYKSGPSHPICGPNFLSCVGLEIWPGPGITSCELQVCNVQF